MAFHRGGHKRIAQRREKGKIGMIEKIEEVGRECCKLVFPSCLGLNTIHIQIYTWSF